MRSKDRRILFSGLVFALMLSTTTALAVPDEGSSDGSSGFSQMFNTFFGSESERGKVESCDSATSAQSMLGQVNSTFCHLEKDMGIKGVGSATKSFSPPGGTDGVTVHCEIAASDSGSYAQTASCWVCSSSCSDASNFDRFMNLQWTYTRDSSGTVTANKGILMMDYGAMGGNAGQAGMSLTYDVGSITSKTISAKMVQNFTGNSMNMRVDGTQTENVQKLTFVSSLSGLGMRFSAAIDKTTNDVLTSYSMIIGSPMSCSSGFESLASDDLAGQLPTCTQCFSRAASATDFDYTSSSSGCSSLGLPYYAADTLTDIENYSLSSSDSTNIMGTNGDWGGMAAHPTSL